MPFFFSTCQQVIFCQYSLLWGHFRRTKCRPSSSSGFAVVLQESLPLPKPPGPPRRICPQEASRAGPRVISSAKSGFLATFFLTPEKRPYSAAPRSHPKHLELTPTRMPSWPVLEIDILFRIWYFWAHDSSSLFFTPAASGVHVRRRSAVAVKIYNYNSYDALFKLILVMLLF